MSKPSEPTELMIAELSRWVLAQCPNARDLTQGELSRYEARDPIHGWVIPFEHQADRFDLRVVLSQDFPWTKPRVYCAEKFQFLQYPHIEKDGAFCLYPPGAEHNPLNPKGLIWDSIKEAARLIVASYDDDFMNDFADEFDSYWNKTDRGKNIVSLLSPGGPSRQVSLWCSAGDYYLADDHTTLESWLRNRFPGNKKDYSFNTATHIALNRPILPSEYPRSGASVLSLLRELAPKSIKLLEEAAAAADDKFTISFEGRTDDGPVFFAVEVMPPVRHSMKAGRRPDMVEKGFRPGKVPPHIRMQRLFGGNKVERHETMRADPSWIHGRDTPTAAPLFEKRVLMIGAGSLGSEVALLLAKTGVGSITLVDPELLDYPNVGRHMLGVTQVRTSKAKSLAEKLAGDFPHMRSIKSFAESWQSVYSKRSDVFQNTDLIVSTVGSWVAEGRLNQVAKNEAVFPPVLYGWAEPFSVAGHAVLVGANGPCFACGMDHFGKALRPVCEWDTETTRKQPHCGASFQPYGPVSLSGVAALVAKTAMKALLGEVPPGTEAVYWASKEEIAEQGGRLSPDFLDYFVNDPDFGGTRKFEWRQKDGCVFCGGS